MLSGLRDRQPRVTVAVPVFNGGAFLRRALSSIKAQTYRNLEVRISDNASSDETENICQEFVAADERFHYLRQPTNIGAFANFRLLAAAATSPLIVFLAADDWWESTFIEENVQALEFHKSAIGSISRVVFDDSGMRLRDSNGDFPIVGRKLSRLRAFFSVPSDNSRFYSVFRTAEIQRCFQADLSFHAIDWYVMACSLCYGGHVRVEKILMHRETAPHDRYNSVVARDNSAYPRFTYFPILPMSFEFIKTLSVLDCLGLLPRLAHLNFVKHREYMRFRYPAHLYTKLISRLV